jgi:hypothetical protein
MQGQHPGAILPVNLYPTSEGVIKCRKLHNSYRQKCRAKMQGKSSPFEILLNGSDMQGQHAGEILPVKMVSDGPTSICRSKILFNKMQGKS